MRFWDASAIVPLLVAEASTPRLQVLAAEDPAMLVWWGSEVECTSALARLERDAALDANPIMAAFSRLGHLKAAWHEVDPSDAVRETAARFLRVHPLRAADAHLAAASPQHLQRQRDGRRHWNSSPWMTASAPLRERRAS